MRHKWRLVVSSSNGIQVIAVTTNAYVVCRVLFSHCSNPFLSLFFTVHLLHLNFILTTDCIRSGNFNQLLQFSKKAYIRLL